MQKEGLMIKIGVISDTHQQGPDERLAKVTDKLFADVSMVLHAGDLVDISVLDAFYDKEVVAVCGNMDGPDVAQKLSAREIIKVDSFKIGLIHGWGSREGLENRIFPEFEGCDVIVYGHTHRAANHIKQGVLMFNPGAFSSWSMGVNQGSVGILTIENNKISGDIIPF